MLVTREQCPLGRLSAAACLCVALTIGVLTAPLSAQPAGAVRPSVDDELLLVPFLLDGVRERLLVDGQVLVYNPVADRTVTLTGLSVRMPGADPASDDVVVFESEYAAELPGDTEFGAMSAVIELLPPELIHRHGDERHFAPADAPLLSGEAALDALRDVVQRLEDYQAELASGRAAPFAALDCVVPLHMLFPEDVVPGDAVTLQLVVSWLDHRGTARTTTIPHTVVWLRPAPRMPPGAAEAWLG